VTTPDVSARRIGRERQPLVIIDNFAPDPDALRAAAIASVFEPADHHYPGIRAPLPKTYFAEIGDVLALTLAEVFECRNSFRIIDASFSIVTHSRDKLRLEQRVPHFDAVESGRIAFVHFLAPGDGDGTAFYRHRATGFETVDAERAPTYLGALNAELEQCPPPFAYIAGETAQFDCISRVDARYNRALVYSSSLLHSGAIGANTALSPDPALGRLTVTAFLDAS
jgi:Family of unknown function (DUF6445)